MFCTVNPLNFILNSGSIDKEAASWNIKNSFAFRIISDQLGKDSVVGRLIQAIIDAVSERGYQVKHAKSDDEAKVILETDPALGCFLIAWGKDFQIQYRNISQQTLIDCILRRGPEAPIFLMTQFPGFENEIQGLYLEPQADGTKKYYTYVVRE